MNLKGTLLFIFFLLHFQSALGQEENPLHKTIADKFESLYNEGRFDDIFNMYTGDMKKALPNDQSNKFFSDLRSGSGIIKKRQFVKYESGFAVYKTNFEQNLFAVNISVSPLSKIDGLLIKPYQDDKLRKLTRNSTKLALPFKGEWFVFWGGDTKALNYHVENKAQKNAFDMVMMDANGKSHRGNGLTNEDYYAFEKEIIAPCDGVVVLAVDGVKDNKPGELNPIYVPGNSVILKTANNEYLFFAHFKKHTVKVREGQQVRKGQLLGLCGNSGNSSEPHLHFHIQNTEDMNIATGVKCYFDSIIVNGKLKTDFSPIKGDKIRSN